MKLNKNEQNYLLTILFKSYILQSVICSGIILVCTVSLDMGLTWVLDVGEIPKSNYGVTYAMYDNNCVICLLF